jgi:hypothetical protein
VKSVNTESTWLLLHLVVLVGSTAALVLQWEFDHSVSDLHVCGVGGVVVESESLSGGYAGVGAL